MIRLYRRTRCLDRDLTVATHHHGQLLREEEVAIKEVIERVVIHRVIEDIVPIGVDRALDAKQVEQRRVDVHMLHHTIGDLAPEGSIGDIEADRHHRPAGRAVVLGAVALIGVITGEHEDRVVIPWLILDGVEEVSERLIGILRRAVDRERARLALLLIPSRDLEGVVVGEGEEEGSEGLSQ